MSIVNRKKISKFKLYYKKKQFPTDFKKFTYLYRSFYLKRRKRRYYRKGKKFIKMPFFYRRHKNKKQYNLKSNIYFFQCYNKNFYILSTDWIQKYKK